jgi:flagellar hook-associated protein 1 FlgK
MREALSGVNIDEELANMIKYQHGYSAAARFITQVDLMLDTIINRMAV